MSYGDFYNRGDHIVGFKITYLGHYIPLVGGGDQKIELDTSPHGINIWKFAINVE